MATHTDKIQARIDPALKQAAEAVFAKIGLSATEAIRLFYKQVEVHKGLPFELRVPNAKTRAAMTEPTRGLKKYASTQQMFTDIGVKIKKSR